MFEIQDTPERTIVYRLEISVATQRWIMNMALLVTLTSTENFVSIIWVSDSLRCCISEDHIICYIL